MSLHQFPNLQIWDNDAFDASSSAADALPLRPISLNLSPASKENRRPAEPNKRFLTHAPLKIIQDPSGGGGGGGDAIDAEIEAVEREIARLSSRLEALRLEKAERDARRRRGRVVPAKFLAPARKIPESPASKIPESQRRRAVSLGPAEIVAAAAAAGGIGRTPRRESCVMKLEGIEEEAATAAKQVKKERERISIMTPKSRLSVAKKPAESPAGASKIALRRRGISLGPLEIAAATNTSAGIHWKSKNPVAKEQAVKNGKEKVRSLSSSPKSRRQPLLTKASDLRKGVATVGAKKPVKREEGTPMSIKPKALFQDYKNGKQLSKNAKVRIVPSRYSLVAPRPNVDEPRSKRRKWSLPDPHSEVPTVSASKRSLSLGESGKNLESEVQVGGELEVAGNVGGMESCLPSLKESPSSIMKIAAMLPKIRTIRCMMESPRDSGCAKRVAELVRRKPYFGSAEEGEDSASTCQFLTFEEEE